MVLRKRTTSLCTGLMLICCKDLIMYATAVPPTHGGLYKLSTNRVRLHLSTELQVQTANLTDGNQGNAYLSTQIYKTKNKTPGMAHEPSTIGPLPTVLSSSLITVLHFNHAGKLYQTTLFSHSVPLLHMFFPFCALSFWQLLPNK